MLRGDAESNEGIYKTLSMSTTCSNVEWWYGYHEEECPKIVWSHINKMKKGNVEKNNKNYEQDLRVKREAGIKMEIQGMGVHSERDTGRERWPE